MAKKIIHQSELDKVVGSALTVDGAEVNMSDTVETFCNTYSKYNFEAYLKSKLPAFIKWSMVKDLTLENACRALGGEETVQGMLDEYIASLTV